MFLCCSCSCRSVITTSFCQFPVDSSSRSWKSRFWKRPNVLVETSAWTATSIPPSPAAVATLWLWISKRSGGTGSLLPNATKPTTAPASASTCSCRNTRTPTWCSTPTLGAPPGPAVRPPRCPPLTCSTLMTSSRSFTARSRGWWWIDVAAPRLQGEMHTCVQPPLLQSTQNPYGALPQHQNPIHCTRFHFPSATKNIHRLFLIFLVINEFILTVKKYKWDMNLKRTRATEIQHTMNNLRGWTSGAV